MLDFSDFREALDDNPFSEYPVDVRTFVLSKDYLGLPPLSEYQYELVEAMSQIFREEDLARYMEKDEARKFHRKYTNNEVIMKLGKGSGKDHSSAVGVAYVVYKLLCLNDPSAYFGKPTGDAIDIINIAINAEQAKNVFFNNLLGKIKRAPWFNGKYEDKVNTIRFDKNVTVYSGHSERESHEGLNLLMAILDEISGFAMFSASQSNEQAKTADNIYDAFKGTVVSRFAAYGKVVLLSFPRYKDDYISKAYDRVIAEKEVVIRTHRFVLDPELPEDHPGNSFEIAWEEDHIIRYTRPKVFALCRPTWDVNPIVHIDELAEAFYTNMSDALMRYCCMPGVSNDTFFQSEEKIRLCLSRYNPVDNKRQWDSRFKPNPNVTYYLHVDLAQVHDKCAVAICHVDKWVNVHNFSKYSKLSPFVVCDAVAYWEPQKEKKPVELSEVKDFIVALRSMGFKIGMVTFDRWQSLDIMNQLKALGIPSDRLSVAKQHYDDLTSLFYEERLLGPNDDALIDELLKLRLLPNGKVDHPGKSSKDISDALAGACYNAILYTPAPANREVEIHTYRQTMDAEREAEHKDRPKPIPEDIAGYLREFRLL